MEEGGGVGRSRVRGEERKKRVEERGRVKGGGEKGEGWRERELGKEGEEKRG